MIRLEPLKTMEQFEEIQKGDSILVKWSDYFVKHHSEARKVMTYDVYENKHNQQEIICQLKGNHYFNYSQHIKGLSCAEEVYKVG